MALGINYEAASGGDFTPVVKYDSRSGRVTRVDRVDSKDVPVDITKSFKAVFDFPNIETGWIHFATGAPPSFSLSLLSSGVQASKPTDQHKPGVRIMVKLSKDCGGDVREIASTAKAFLRGIDALHNEYEAQKGSHPNQLPVVVIKDTVPIVTEGGGQKSTNYSPVFEIVGWVNRPTDLTYTPKQAVAQAAPAANARQAAPTTGSTVAAAPAASAAVAADDFG